MWCMPVILLLGGETSEGLWLLPGRGTAFYVCIPSPPPQFIKKANPAAFLSGLGPLLVVNFLGVTLSSSSFSQKGQNT